MVVEEGAERVGLVVEEGLFFGSEFGLVGVNEVLEGGGAGEDVAVEA